ncbi:WecB/TagA/CpsF family glycosyltransferase [Sphingobium sp. AS12]|nr:WecB/TagA/CpsF family glycosyltransferase [Sphingobium sp. AS12]
MLSDVRKARENGASPTYNTSANGNVISQWASDPELRAVMSQADSIAADGVSVMWGAKLFAGEIIPDRAATTDLFHDLAEAAQQHGYSIYLLGATAEQNAKALERIRKLYPGLNIAGGRDGYFCLEEEAGVCEEIVKAGTDILFVGLGVGRQDFFVDRNISRLQGVGWVKTCGGLFDFLAGLRSRAPEWMQRNGLEWLYRTMLEPRRLLLRYATTNTRAIWMMITASGKAS